MKSIQERIREIKEELPSFSAADRKYLERNKEQIFKNNPDDFLRRYLNNSFSARINHLMHELTNI